MQMRASSLLSVLAALPALTASAGVIVPSVIRHDAWHASPTKSEGVVLLSGQRARTGSLSGEAACLFANPAARAAIQNSLAGQCQVMCKTVQAFPDCSQCPPPVESPAPPALSAAMPWPDLLEHMDNLVDWGRSSIQRWRQMSLLQRNRFHQIQQTASSQTDFMDFQADRSCIAADARYRVHVQNKLARNCMSTCDDTVNLVCAECPVFVNADAGSGVMMWSELLDRMQK
eukprot:TRINITY_DN3871_c0_g1_i1.p1 TRINITY_DN3871_c0_g1~~TRINITY_DN3871_c0_g1_i1.p1  ORF type:complete len:230 (-),score=28.96 TRINITY_DN3871_c0_g1_i1:167-856(-)